MNIMDATILKYVESGNALIENSRLAREERERQAQEQEDLRRSEFVAKALMTAHTFMPADLHKYLVVPDGHHNEKFADLELKLPDCYVIEFQIYLPENRRNGEFVIKQGKPLLDRDYDGYPYKKVIAHEYRDSVKSDILDYVIAIAYKRQQKENELLIECNAYNEQARQEAEAKQEVTQETMQVPPAPTLEERLASVLREFIQSVNE